MYEMMLKLKDGNDLDGMSKLFNDPEIQKQMEAQAGGSNPFMDGMKDMGGMGNLDFDAAGEAAKNIEMPSGDQL